MDATEPQFLEVGTGAKCRRIAYRFTDRKGRGAGAALAAGLPLRHGENQGGRACRIRAGARTADAPLRLFRPRAVAREHAAKPRSATGWKRRPPCSRLIGDRRTILIGSSMGGWIALLARPPACSRQASLSGSAGLVLLAPAWDMTERLMWQKLSPKTKSQIETRGRLLRAVALRRSLSHDQASDRGGPHHLLGEGAVRSISTCRCASCKAWTIPTCPGATRSISSISCMLRRRRAAPDQGRRPSPSAGPPPLELTVARESAPGLLAGCWSEPLKPSVSPSLACRSTASTVAPLARAGRRQSGSRAIRLRSTARTVLSPPKARRGLRGRWGSAAQHQAPI